VVAHKHASDQPGRVRSGAGSSYAWPAVLLLLSPDNRNR